MNELKRRAVALLARREHARTELAARLAPYGTKEEIATVLSALENSGLLSDARYAENYLHAHVGRFGNARLRQELRKRGVAAELIARHLVDGELPDELERARQVWARKFSALPGDHHEWARQARFLQGRGFSIDMIRRLLKAPSASDD